MQIRADLHIHSVYSDGRLTPRELIDKAKKAGLMVISITDHDSVGAVEEAVSYGRKAGVTVIPGLELSAEIDSKEVHILGYFIDHKSDTLLNFLSECRENRIKRSKLIIGKLNEMGSRITFSNVSENTDPETAIGRPHIAQALSNEGFVSSYSEAFYKYIGDGKPAYVKKPSISARDALKVISESGGLSFIAHPGKNFSEENLKSLIDCGIDGIEIVHPSHTKEDREMLSRTASLNFLLTSGGSDYHGGLKNDHKNFGAYYISAEEVNVMKRRLTC